LRPYTLYYAIIAAFFLVSCKHSSKETAEQPSIVSDQAQDPFEPVNRRIFEFNRVVDGLILEPFANLYNLTVNEHVKKSVSSFLYNLTEPVTFTNDCLQGKGEKGLEAFSRFMINTIFGLFGLFDVAEKLGLPHHQEDFGQTLAVWGVPSGPYLVVPLLGSSTPRSLGGRLTDFYISPYNYYMVHYDHQEYIYIRLGFDTLVKRAQYADDIKNFRENSLDFYAAVRSFYLQNQKAQVQSESVIETNVPSADSFDVSDDDSKLWE
jgi:phospholipid-binding lipoprotein MlaA